MVYSTLDGTRTGLIMVLLNKVYVTSYNNNAVNNAYTPKTKNTNLIVYIYYAFY